VKLHNKLPALHDLGLHTGVIKGGKGAGDGVPSGMTLALLQQIIIDAGRHERERHRHRERTRGRRSDVQLRPRLERSVLTAVAPAAAPATAQPASQAMG
jgi:hypothetical protein